MNRVEIVFGIVTLALGGYQHRHWKTFLPVALLAFQTVVLIPTLLDRARIIIEGGTPRKSLVHVMYIVSELAKVGSLLYAGVLFVFAGGQGL